MRLNVLRVVEAVLLLRPGCCLVGEAHFISQVEHIFYMLRLVLSIRVRLRSHALELVLVRYFDWACSVEELRARIQGGCGKLCTDDASATRLSVPNAPRALSLLQHAICEHLAVEEGHVALILIEEAIIRIVRLELSHQVLGTGWTS